MKHIYLLAAIAAAVISCTAVDKTAIQTVPYPNHVEMKAGEFKAAGADFHYDAAMDDASVNVVKSLAEKLSAISGTESSVMEGDAKTGFIFKVNPDLPAEAYELTIGKKCVTVEASALNGFNYAVQTIKQMLPSVIFGTEAAPEEKWTLVCCEIKDEPRFSYRGMHLDVSRHFFDMDMVKKYLDVMEIHKLNTLHWHLTDDQGWRIEIKKYPKLTEIGSIRKETLIGHSFTSKTYDGKPYGEGMWYSQEQIREIISYAASKGIDIIPEIDLPGHMLAALAAYPHLGCTGKSYDVWGRWGIADEVLCAGKEETMIFLEDVLDEVADLFPSEYIHIGGDECPKTYWETCPHCQAKIKELGLKDTEEFKAEHYLQSYVMNRMTEFLSKKGKKVIGWDEILEGEVADNAIVMSWRGTAGGIKAAQLGHDAIMTPNSFFYLDYYQSEDIENEPFGIGGYLPVEKCYSYEPFADEMTEEEKKHIIGVQANLWTEYIPSDEHLEYMLLPRMAALSEVQWCQMDNKDWNRFRESADNFCAIYDMAGYNYATHIFNVNGSVSVKDGSVFVTLEAQGDTPVRYTLDGSEPDENSILYEGPVKIEGACTIKAKSILPNMKTRVFSKTFGSHKAMAKNAEVTSAAHHNYNAGLPHSLTDGIRGTFNYKSTDWAGWYTGPFEAVIDMAGETYSTVTLGTVSVKYDWIFCPESIVISTSDDGKTFTEVAKAVYGPEKEDAPNELKEYTLSFPETSARYLKVWAETTDEIPDWHEAAGKPGFLFVDEIVVR